MDTNLFGKVAKCKHGKIGVIHNLDRETYYGVSLNGSKWQSNDPKIIAENLNEYIDIYCDALFKTGFGLKTTIRGKRANYHILDELSEWPKDKK